MAASRSIADSYTWIVVSACLRAVPRFSKPYTGVVHLALLHHGKQARAKARAAAAQFAMFEQVLQRPLTAAEEQDIENAVANSHVGAEKQGIENAAADSHAGYNAPSSPSNIVRTPVPGRQCEQEGDSVAALHSACEQGGVKEVARVFIWKGVCAECFDNRVRAYSHVVQLCFGS